MRDVRHTARAGKVAFNYDLGAGRSESLMPDLPARVMETMTESYHRAFYTYWSRVMGRMISVDLAMRERITAFYAYETMLLDDDRLREWLELIDDDVRYVMPMRETRLGPAMKNANPTFYLYNNDKASLDLRIARLETGMALVESPVFATQRIVTDVHVLKKSPTHAMARSSFFGTPQLDSISMSTLTRRICDQARLAWLGTRISH